MGETVPFEPSDDDRAFASGVDAEQASRNRNRRGRPASLGAGTQAGSESRPHLGAASARLTPYGTKELPHSVVDEEGVIAACCIDPDHLGRFQQRGLSAAAFFGAEGGVAWGMLCEMMVKRVAIDAGALFSELTRVDKPEVARWVLEVSAKFPTSAEADLHAKRVIDLAVRRRVIRVATEAVERAFEGKEDIEELTAGVSEKIMAVTGQHTGLPAVIPDGALDGMALPEPPMLIEGVLHRGRRTLLLAPSKASKTWTAMDMSVAIASGSAWLGFKTHKSAVLHIDLELPTWDLKKRRNKLCELREIKGPLDVEWWSLDGYQRSIDELLPLIVARAPHGKFGMIVIEPAYVILGKRDENDNADVTDFMNRLAWLARLTGAAVLCTHHFAKGDASKKEAKDRASGAGAWVRAPDTAITLTPLDEEQGEDCYKMEFIERSMKRHAPVGVQFEYPVFRLKSGLDLNALREAGRPREFKEKDIVRVLGEDKLTHGQWMKAVGVGKEGHMSERTFNRNLKEALTAGLVTQNGPIYAAAGSK